MICWAGAGYVLPSLVSGTSRYLKLARPEGRTAVLQTGDWSTDVEDSSGDLLRQLSCAIKGSYNRSLPCMEAAPNRTFLCMEATYVSLMLKACKAKYPHCHWLAGILCLSLVPYGMTNESGDFWTNESGPCCLWRQEITLTVTECDWSGEHGTQEDNTGQAGAIFGQQVTINIPRLDWPDRRQSDHITMQTSPPLIPSIQ